MITPDNDAHAVCRSERGSFDKERKEESEGSWCFKSRHGSGRPFNCWPRGLL
jgi:hypothetical protein